MLGIAVFFPVIRQDIGERRHFTPYLQLYGFPRKQFFKTEEILGIKRRGHQSFFKIRRRHEYYVFERMQAGVVLAAERSEKRVFSGAGGGVNLECLSFGGQLRGFKFIGGFFSKTPG
ncbi:MAG TPA: hypothetical protein DCG50_10230 [Elusimicrobia bacterium]|nr:hypothetical protein [Elusimicrobiota bacterium]